MKISIAIITDSKNNILITQRAYRLDFGGYWEFPGGKIEIGESAEDALIRELEEELAIKICVFDFLVEYKSNNITMFVYHVSDYGGEITLTGGQIGMKWVKPEMLCKHKFPQANEHLILHVIKDFLNNFGSQ